MFSSTLVDLHLHDRGTTLFPALAPPASQAEILGTIPTRALRANLASPVWEALAGRWRLKGDLEGKSARELVHRLFGLALAISHAPQYQEDHKESLGQDWAHLPIPRDRAIFLETSRLGETIAALLNPLSDPRSLIRRVLRDDATSLAAAEKLGGGPIRKSDYVVSFSYNGAAKGKWIARDPGDSEPMRPAWGARTGDLFINDEVFFRHVPESVWRYELGGYPVLKKWLGYRDSKRRDGAPLSFPDEVDHFQQITQRLAALLALHEKLDRAYERCVADPFSSEDLGI
jgi:hypothetical protein